jgi:hypothetical protein
MNQIIIRREKDKYKSYLRGKTRHTLAEDGHMETERDEREY